jgi:hypothetical protein
LGSSEHDFAVGDSADFVVFGNQSAGGYKSFRSRTSIQELVYDAGHDRATVFKGRLISS